MKSIIKNKITKYDETFYNKYSEMNEKFRNQNINPTSNADNNEDSPYPNIMFGQLAAVAKESAKNLNQYAKLGSSVKVMKEKIQRRESKVMMLDYAMQNQHTDENKYLYNKVQDKTQTTNHQQAIMDFMSKKESSFETA